MKKWLIYGVTAFMGLSSALASPAAAQRGGRWQRSGKDGRGNAVEQDSGRRSRLERRFRERGAEIVRERLKLTDDQMRRLREVNGRLEPRRRALFQQERETQLSLRAELARGASADQRRVAQLMDRTRALQRQRFDLQQEEQHSLSAFLSPVQQARYFGLQQQLRKRARELSGGDGKP